MPKCEAGGEAFWGKGWPALRLQGPPNIYLSYTFIFKEQYQGNHRSNITKNAQVNQIRFFLVKKNNQYLIVYGKEMNSCQIPPPERWREIYLHLPIIYIQHIDRLLGG